MLAREASHVVHPVAGLCMGDMICEHHGTRSQRSVELPDLAVVFRIGPQGDKTRVIWQSASIGCNETSSGNKRKRPTIGSYRNIMTNLSLMAKGR